MCKQVRIKVAGRVQGVFFRANTRTEARKLGLTGTVRNTSDGGVEITAQGNECSLNTFINWCRIGPPASKVTSIEINWEEFSKKFNSFEITY